MQSPPELIVPTEHPDAPFVLFYCLFRYSVERAFSGGKVPVPTAQGLAIRPTSVASKRDSQAMFELTPREQPSPTLAGVSWILRYAQHGRAILIGECVSSGRRV